MANEINQTIDFKVDRKNLYREETVTDLKSCSIRKLTPVKDDGSTDKTRKTIYVGQTTLMSPNGAVPIQAVIEAKELQQALKHFPESMQAALEHLVEEAKRLKRDESSRIIVPGR
jgi:hypothetical protein